MAYADFVTAMMALFLVLWLVTQGDQKLKENLANYFRSPGVFQTTNGGIFDGSNKALSSPVSLTHSEPASQAALYDTAVILKKQLGAGGKLKSFHDQVKVDMVKQGLRIQILDKAEQSSFESGSATLNPTTRHLLDEIAMVICKLPHKIQIGGHTDAYTYPTSHFTNWELSADRANAARRELEAACIDPKRIHRIVGYADTELLDPEHPYAPSNRRISIILLGNENAHPEVLPLTNEEFGIVMGRPKPGSDGNSKF